MPCALVSAPDSLLPQPETARAHPRAHDPREGVAPVTITMTPPAAALCALSAARPRVGSAGSPTWRDTGAVVGVPTYMRTKSAFATAVLNHNSILSTVDVIAAPAVRDGNVAAKQAGPPRGVPR
jgi:hypothetical protein